MQLAQQSVLSPGLSLMSREARVSSNQPSIMANRQFGPLLEVSSGQVLGVLFLGLGLLLERLLEEFWEGF